MDLRPERLDASGRIIAGAEHDVIGLSIHTRDLDSIVTREQVVTLSRCGVHVDEYGDLCMFV